MKLKLIMLVLVATLAAPIFMAQAQTKSQAKKTEQTSQHKIVYDLSVADTTMHAGLMRQLNNIKRGWPDAQIEVVVHGKALNLLVTGKSTQANAIEELQAKGVVFAACQNTMKRAKVEKSQLLPDVPTVPMGIGEIVTKQEEGWSYIKF
ncbi:DsrE family protein [Pontibacter litorisediminis]|uniref:DsrE family protein n=1 Tax=Pontibacter litorisediminis TaxID=1846260 RepID=UPI0023ED966D|nr:DsrE family protein [Pontibacter litorisediminis]